MSSQNNADCMIIHFSLNDTRKKLNHLTHPSSLHNTTHGVSMVTLYKLKKKKKTHTSFVIIIPGNVFKKKRRDIIKNYYHYNLKAGSSANMIIYCSFIHQFRVFISILQVSCQMRSKSDIYYLDYYHSMYYCLPHQIPTCILQTHLEAIIFVWFHFDSRAKILQYL